MKKWPSNPSSARCRKRANAMHVTTPTEYTTFRLSRSSEINALHRRYSFPAAAGWGAEGPAAVQFKLLRRVQRNAQPIENGVYFQKLKRRMTQLSHVCHE
jgi:hypothetical protein